MKENYFDLDEADLIILRELQRDSSVSNVELARRLQLSPPATHTRVKRLESLGYIKKYVAVIDAEKIGYDLICFITVSLQIHKPEDVHHFRDLVANMPEVLECYHVTGDYDYILKVALRNRKDLQRFLMENLTPVSSVARIHTRIALTEVKSTTEFPLE